MFGIDSLLVRPWIRPALIVSAVVVACSGFTYTVVSYGRSQYQLGRADRTNEVLEAQTTQLTTLVARVAALGDATSAQADVLDHRMLDLTTAAHGLLADAANRVLLVPGPDGRCAPTEDWRTLWNRASALPARAGKTK